ncbi:MAG: hypothetical protein P8184_06915, partial [Calditrichia bacterium]
WSVPNILWLKIAAEPCRPWLLVLLKSLRQYHRTADDSPLPFHFNEAAANSKQAPQSKSKSLPENSIILTTL